MVRSFAEISCIGWVNEFDCLCDGIPTRADRVLLYTSTMKSVKARYTLGLRGICVVFSLLAMAGSVAFTQQQPAPGEGWPTYGGDAGGMRFSKSTEITRANLGQLHPAWTFHTHALGSYPDSYGHPSFESTPVLSGDTLYFTSPYDAVFALDARTGQERWHYTPRLDPIVYDGGMVTSRGVSLWPLGSTPDASLPPCSRRVFVNTLDARLIALDSSTGSRCTGFGDDGVVDLRKDVHFTHVGGYGMTSPPTVIGNVVVVGSSITDNQRVDTESGMVRGYDAVTGKQLWSWEPLPWAQTQKVRTGSGNTWAVISADPALGLVYLPTGSPAPDYYGGMRPGDNRDSDSIVALDAATGKKVWAFQVVHHDLWDYDIASEPVLFTWRGTTPAIAVTTKMGLIFLFDRRNGKPLVPVEERPVPQSDVKGEVTSPTQPFQNIPPLNPLIYDPAASVGYNRPPEDVAICKAQFDSFRYDGMYTPPSLKGSLFFPGNLGGVDWGGAAIDPSTGILYANTNRAAFVAKLVPRYSLAHLDWLVDGIQYRKKILGAIALLILVLAAVRRRSFNPGWPLLLLAALFLVFLWQWKVQSHRNQIPHVGYELAPETGAPYLVEHHPPVDGHHLPCTPAPWGGITAVNLNTLTKIWEKPLGTDVQGEVTGMMNFGGPIVTASGLVITAGALDNWLRVYDATTGELLQQVPLPAIAASTPMTYTLDGRQYIVVAAGGHYSNAAALGDSLVAFSIN
jgi:quinoprotein glucose dehydrogenase